MYFVTYQPVTLNKQREMTFDSGAEFSVLTVEDGDRFETSYELWRRHVRI